MACRGQRRMPRNPHRITPGDIRPPDQPLPSCPIRHRKLGSKAISDNLLAYQDQHGINTISRHHQPLSSPKENPTPGLINMRRRRPDSRRTSRSTCMTPPCGPRSQKPSSGKIQGALPRVLIRAPFRKPWLGVGRRRSWLQQPLMMLRCRGWPPRSQKIYASDYVAAGQGEGRRVGPHEVQCGVDEQERGRQAHMQAQKGCLR